MRAEGRNGSPGRNLRTLAEVLALGVIGFVGVLLVTGGKLDLSALRAVRMPYLLACLALVVLDWVSEALRLSLLAAALGEKVRLLEVLRVVFLGAFFARITPFDSGGEPFQVYQLHRNGVALGHATAVIAVKALLHGLARVCLGLLVPVWLLLTAHGWQLGRSAEIALYAGMAVYLGISALIVATFVNRGRVEQAIRSALRWPWLRRIISERRFELFMKRLDAEYRNFKDALRHFGSARRGTVVLVGVISLLSWSAVLAVPVILVRALGGASPLAEVAATAIIFYLAVAYAPTPGSSGVSELGFATLFARFVPLPLVGVLVLVWRLLTHYLALVLGFVVTSLTMFTSGRGHDRGGGGSDASLPGTK